MHMASADSSAITLPSIASGVRIWIAGTAMIFAHEQMTSPMQAKATSAISRVQLPPDSMQATPWGMTVSPSNVRIFVIWPIFSRPAIIVTMSMPIRAATLISPSAML